MEVWGAGCYHLRKRTVPAASARPSGHGSASLQHPNTLELLVWGRGGTVRTSLSWEGTNTAPILPILLRRKAVPWNRKTWAEKLGNAEAKAAHPHHFYCKMSKQRMVIPAVDEMEQLMRGVRKGRLMAIKQMTDLFRERHDVDQCCPITTGIFAWIIAHAADGDERSGRKRVPPWWRVLKTGGYLNPKWPGHGKTQRSKLETEGHRVLQKGKNLVVDDYESALVGFMKPQLRPEPKLGRETSRKVLRRENFGLCVLLPKTDWPLLPHHVTAQVLVNGITRRVTVQSEKCNCRGTGWHEHRFLSLPVTAGVKEGSQVKINVK